MAGKTKSTRSASPTFLPQANYFSGENDSNFERNKAELSDEELKKVCSYLENPVGEGYWKLEMTSKDFGGATKFVLDMLGFKEKDLVNMTSRDDFEKIRRISTLSLVTTIFKHILEEKEGVLKSKSIKIETDGEYKEILNSIDLSKLGNKYKAALKHFKKEIYHEEFDPAILSDRFYRIRKGVVMILGAYSVEELSRHFYTGKLFEKETKKEFISLEKKPLMVLLEFFRLVGKVEKSKIFRVFSPEEELFQPYLNYLYKTYAQIFKDREAMKERLGRSISEFQDDKYSHGITTLGLIGEDILTQVYESLFRTFVPKKLTMRQIYQLIHKEIEKYYSLEEFAKPDPRTIYGEIRTLSKDLRKVTKNDLLMLSRKTLKFQEDSRKYLQEKIGVIGGEKVKISIFPQHIRDNILELIANRNNSTHKVAVTLGEPEALKSLYCCLSLVWWWDKEKATIVWDAERSEIVQLLVDKASE